MEILFIFRKIYFLFMCVAVPFVYAQTSSDLYLSEVSSDVEVLENIEEDILSAALDHCGRGEVLQADILFDEIIYQLNPPEKIINILNKLKEKRCTLSLNESDLDFRMGGGYDSNVNQGTSAQSIVLGGLENTFELLLNDGYRPKGSTYYDFSLQKILKINKKVNISIKGGLRNYSQLSEYDQAQLGFTIYGHEDMRLGYVQWVLDRSDMWLNGKYYYHGWLGGIQISPAKESPWRGTLLIQKLNYSSNANQNSRVLQLGLIRAFSIKKGIVQMSAGWLHDQAQGTRAGGLRTGYVAGIHLYWQINNWLLSSRINRISWLSHEYFLPGLIDHRRENSSLSWSLNAEYAMANKNILQISISHRDTKDNIALYANKNWGMNFNLIKKF